MMAGEGEGLAQVPVAFADVAVYFSPAEWAELAEWQKELYQDVMAENFELVCSLECLLSIPELLSRLLRWETPSAPETPQPRRISDSPKEEEEEEEPPATIVTLSEQPDENGQPDSPKSPEPKALKRARLRRPRTAEKGPEKSPPLRLPAQKREKPYKCPKCQRSFLYRVALIAHRRLHARKWPRIGPPGPGRSPSSPSSSSPRSPPDPAVPQEGHSGSGPTSPFPRSPGEGGPLPFWPEMSLHQQGPAGHGFNPWALGYGPQPLPGHQAPGLHSNGEFICDQCGWSFHGWEELVTHQMAHMAAEGIAGSVPKAGALAQLATDRPYSCNLCGKSFRHKPNLLAHRQVHTGERRYQCQECGKSFGSKAYLASHQHIHTGEKPYVCGQCGKSFRHKPNLISHQKIHSREPLSAPQQHPPDAFNGEAAFPGVRPVPDPLGAEAFQAQQQRVLAAHRSCAQGDSPLLPPVLPLPPTLLPTPLLPPPPAVDRPFICPVCAKPFRCKPYLVAHIRIHTGEKPYACSRCPKRFSQKSNLVSHERLHTGEKPYACPLCPRVFSQGSNMRAHQRSHRNIVPAEAAEGPLRQGYAPAAGEIIVRQIQAQPN
nr:PREDICTED: replication initiator 1 [Anolis carolinensis]|eukprot:XP_008123618.1 PREDICTED: replication initiator 1 [Anolis carolinensis]